MARKAEGASHGVRAADCTERHGPCDMKQTDTSVQENWGYNQRDASCFSSKSQDSNYEKGLGPTLGETQLRCSSPSLLPIASAISMFEPSPEAHCPDL